MMETADARLKRLTMRSWRRGTKEMDLILGPFADVHVAHMDEATLATYDTLLNENDQDLIVWIMDQSRGGSTGGSAPPTALIRLLSEIAEFATERLMR